MFKSKTVRVVGFVGSMGLSAALLGTAATSTGAWFTDSEAGTVMAKSGTLTVDKNNNYNLFFDKLIPGQDQTKDVGYHTGGDAPSDIWLSFPNGDAYGAFTGQKGYPNVSDGGLGRYGHFAVYNNAGNLLFNSYNLTNQPDGTSGCADSEGHGSNSPATSATDTPAYCGVPHYMKIESNVASGTDAKLTLLFGLTGRATGQNKMEVPSLPFQVVATQVGVRPDASNF